MASNPHFPEDDGTGNGEELRDAVRRYKARRERWKKEGEWSLARTLAAMRSLGWMIVLPTVIGVFLGRWLDRTTGGGVFWTAGLLFLGLAAGCWFAWDRVSKDDEPWTKT